MTLHVGNFTVTDGVSGNHEVDLIQRGGGNYTYYKDGSLKSDENKEITNIIYDSYLDKPKEVQLTGSRWVKMSYDGGGSLLKREFSTGEYWDFVSNTIYKNGVLYQMGTPEGRAVYQNSNWQYEFFYQDHLSNARVSFGANGQNLVTNDITDFDPTGIPLSGIGVENSVENRFKFLNRERIPTFDLGVSVPSESPARDSEALVYVFWRMFFTPFSHKPSPSESPTCLRETLRELKIKSVCQKVNTELWQPVGRYTYNGIGEMTQKTLGCKLQVLSYKYDLRSRMIALNNPANLEASKSFFGMSLAYDDVGNISKQTYSFAQRKGKHTDPFAVKQNDLFTDEYSYDALNRLAGSKLSKGGVGNYIYKLDNMSYDANGNIKTLERWWQGQYKDRLVYDYGNNTSNRLLKVDDSGENNNQATEEFFTENSTDATDFTYDDAGNMITDANKDISLTYNYLNLVKTAKGNSYTYTATGQKNRMVSPAGTFDYIGSVVFKNNEVEFVATPEGRVLPPAPNPNSVKQNGAKFDPPYPTAPDTTNKYWRYEYDIKDHLGNLRVACRCAEQIETAQTNRNADRPEIGYAPTVVQQAHYDPWGVKLPLFSGYGGDRYKGSPEDRFKYNGKEQQPDIGYYDYGARMYDPTVGRWFGVDLLANKYLHLSPYIYVANIPTSAIDPNGKDIILVGKNGRLLNAYNTLMKTDEGKRLYEKYGNNSTHDIYINSQDNLNIKTFGNKNYERTAGITLENANSFLKNGKLGFNKDGSYSEFFRSFQDVDFSNSKDKKVSLVNLFETSFESKDNKLTTEMEDLENAETIHHEIVAHIEFNSGSSNEATKMEHEKYGKTNKGIPLFHYFDSSVITVEPKGNSPAEKFIREAIKLYLENKPEK